MNSLNLNVVQSIKRNFNTSVLFDPCSKPFFVLSFDLNEFVLEVIIFGKGSKLSDLAHVCYPLFNITNSV
jgi:hypothetical protein